MQFEKSQSQSTERGEGSEMRVVKTILSPEMHNGFIWKSKRHRVKRRTCLALCLMLTTAYGL